MAISLSLKVVLVYVGVLLVGVLAFFMSFYFFFEVRGRCEKFAVWGQRLSAAMRRMRAKLWVISSLVGWDRVLKEQLVRVCRGVLRMGDGVWHGGGSVGQGNWYVGGSTELSLNFSCRLGNYNLVIYLLNAE